jgi:hypothetical protein
LTKPEQAQIILQEVDAAYSVASYLEEDIKTAIIKALVMIEREETHEAKDS